MEYYSLIKNNIYSDDKEHKVKTKIKDIFIDHWDIFLDYAKEKSLTIRNVVLKEVDKIINCGTNELGYSQFDCPTPNCNGWHIVFHTCKSRFCSSCGVRYLSDRINALKNTILDVKHRHMVFTIPAELRRYFRADRMLINILFNAVNLTISDVFDYKAITPGFICTLHTYGKDIKWNPHIHVLVTEGGLNKLGKYIDFYYLSFELLRKKFQYHLLTLLSKELASSFDELKDYLFNNYPKGFYVRAKKKKSPNNIKEAEYILRYSGKPAIAASRIINYNDHEVIFKYHTDEHEQIVTLSIFDFFKKLIVHIHDENFKTIRYYGIYTSQNKQAKTFSECNTYDNIKSEKLSWRELIIKSFKKDPLICKDCNRVMELVFSYFPP